MKNAAFSAGMKHFKVSRLAKFAAVFSVLIVLVAVAVIIGVGETTGNYTSAVGIGIDFRGGTILTVNDLADDENLADRIDAIENAIESVRDVNGSTVTISYVQRLGGSGGVDVIFRYQNVSGDESAIDGLNADIVSAVNGLLYPDGEAPADAVTTEFIGATAADDLIMRTGVAFAVAAVIVALYVLIRFKPAAAVSVLIVLIHDIAVMFALTVICRVQINTQFIVALLAMMVFSVASALVLYDRCRGHVKPLKGMKNIDYAAVGDAAVRENMRKSVIAAVILLVAAVLLSALGSASMREFSIPFMLGVLTVLYSSVFVSAPLWAALSDAFDKLNAKRTAGAVYAGASSDDDKEQIVAVKKDEDDDGDGFAPQKTRKSSGSDGSKPDGNKPKGKPIYKYSKKNTTFKKK